MLISYDLTSWFPDSVLFTRTSISPLVLNPFSAELFKVDYSMLKLGRLYIHVIGFLEYLYNSQSNNADFRWDSSLRADSRESVLFAISSILPVALKELKGLNSNCWSKCDHIQLLFANKANPNKPTHSCGSILVYTSRYPCNNMYQATNILYTMCM